MYTDRRIFFPVFTILLSFYFSSSGASEDKIRSMLQDLRTVKHQYQCCYAPMNWKKEFADWDFEQAYRKAKYEILSTPGIRTGEFRRIVRDFCYSLHDYHADVFFISTEQAQLPFEVQKIGEDYLIVWIDRSKIPEHYELHIGDRLVEFGGQPVAEAMAQLKIDSGSKASNERTDSRLLAERLTFRLGTIGDKVPSGPVLVKIRSHRTGEIIARQLIWDYEPESVASSLDFLQHVSGFSDRTLSLSDKNEPDKYVMIDPLFDLFNRMKKHRAHGQESESVSFVPVLGKLLWTNEEENDAEEEYEPESDDENFDRYDMSWRGHAYIYLHPEGYKIGYIRIPDYSIEVDELQTLGNIIRKMEAETAGLIIDQTDNPGGDLFAMYGFASMLITEPLQAPGQHIKLNSKIVYHMLKRLNTLNKSLNAGKYSVSANESNHLTKLFLKNYYAFILDEWAKGKTLTDPHYLFDTDMINPHPFSAYTKPIIVLINEMSLSCAELLPAILQDHLSDRVKLFGIGTAGAGGCVKELSFKSHSGIDSMTYTWTLAIRKDGTKIENIGVDPDIPYEITERDILTGYSEYAARLNRAVDQLIRDYTEKKNPDSTYTEEEKEAVSVEG